MTRDYNVWIEHLRYCVPIHIKFKVSSINLNCDCSASEPDNILEAYHGKNIQGYEKGNNCLYHRPFNEDKFYNFGFKFYEEKYHSFLYTMACNNGRSYFNYYVLDMPHDIGFYIRLPPAEYDIIFYHYSTFFDYNYRLISTADKKTQDFLVNNPNFGFITNTITYKHTGGNLEIYRISIGYRTSYQFWGGVSIHLKTLLIDYGLINPQKLYGDLINNKQQSINELGAIAGNNAVVSTTKVEVGSQVRLLREIFV